MFLIGSRYLSTVGTRVAKPNDVSGFAVSIGTGQPGQLRTYAFIEKKFHPAVLRGATRRSATMTAQGEEHRWPVPAAERR